MPTCVRIAALSKKLAINGRWRGQKGRSPERLGRSRPAVLAPLRRAHGSAAAYAPKRLTDRGFRATTGVKSARFRPIEPAQKRKRFAMHEATSKSHWHEPSAARRPASASSRSRRRPMTRSWSRKAFRASAASASSACRTCRSSRGSVPAAAAPMSSSTAPRPSGAATSSKCRGAGALNPEKHMYEEIFLVVEGRGTTEVWHGRRQEEHTFEWQKGSMFSIPMNAMHRIVNATSQPRAAAGRHHGAERAEHDQQRRRGVQQSVHVPRPLQRRATTSSRRRTTSSPIRCAASRMRRTNFIPDVINCDLPLDNRRSPAGAASSRS